MTDLRFEIPTGPFGTIYADPPWPHDKEQNARRRLHFDRMSFDELARIPIADAIHADGHLWLWTTTTHLALSLRLVEAWGFQYKTTGVWRKSRLGLGWWLRNRHEFLLFAARSTRYRHNPGNWSTEIVGRYRGHSHKPLEAYAHIEALSPGPYLELFSHDEEPRESWTRLGAAGALRDGYNKPERVSHDFDPNDGLVRGVGGLEIVPGETYHYLERIIRPVAVVAVSQKARRVTVEIDGKKKSVSIDKLRAVEA